MADDLKMGEQAKFREMLEGSKEDWDIISEHAKHFNKGLAKRVKARIMQASTSEIYGDPAVHPSL